MLVPYTWVLPSCCYFNPSPSWGLEGKQMAVCWYLHAILLWHLSSARKILSFAKVPLMDLITKASEFLRDCLFHNRNSLRIRGQPIFSCHLEGLGLLQNFERSHPSWALSVYVLGGLGAGPGQHPRLLVLGVLGRRLKSAGALLMELLSVVLRRHNFMMRLHQGL